MNWSLENSKRGFRLVAAGPNGTQRVAKRTAEFKKARMEQAEKEVQP